MTMNTMDLKSRCSIRGRAAFVLAIAEQCVGLLKYSERPYALATKALEEAWKWEEGHEVAASHLYSYLENPAEEALMVYEWDCPEAVAGGFVAVTSALAYVVWHAYKQQGITTMPSSIQEVSEAVIDQVIDFARQSQDLSVAYVDCLSKFLVEKCRSAGPTELGGPIERASVLNIGSH
jgi:hypothetical protein